MVYCEVFKWCIVRYLSGGIAWYCSGISWYCEVFKWCIVRYLSGIALALLIAGLNEILLYLLRY